VFVQKQANWVEFKVCDPFFPGFGAGIWLIFRGKHFGHNEDIRQTGHSWMANGKEQQLTEILFITPQKDRFTDLGAGIQSNAGNPNWSTSGRQALERLQRETVDLVVVDEDLGDMPGLKFVEQLVAVNPMINCALVSSLSKEDYHEASEGLGILMQLSPEPSTEDGVRLISQLNRILGLAGPQQPQR